MNEKILVVDDEKEIADLLEVYLKNDNYIVHKYYNGIEALECIQKTEIDLAILDVMLPDIDGFRICQKIRENYYFPVIMLTAKIDDGDKIMGLTIGADDYITKPFNPLEVIARVKTQLRRYQIKELTKRIEDAVAALPESYRQAFVMHRFRDMSYKEIAETLEVSPKTVDYRIQQALKQLRIDLKDYLPLLLPLLFP